MKIHYVFLLFFLFIKAPVSFGQKMDLSLVSSKFHEKVDSIVNHKMDEYDIPGLSIGLVKNNSILYAKGFGIKKTGGNDQVSENSIFHTASISKLFTALAIVQLIDKNLTSFDCKLVDIVPELNFKDKRAKDVTIKELLNHTSGLPDINNYHWENNCQSENCLEEYILGLNLKLSAQPSSEYHYSNLGYDILGYIVEKISGSTFEDYVKKNILNPNGMHNSDFRYFKIPDLLRTSPHSKTFITKNRYARKVYPYTREHSPSSTLNASSKDLSKWMIQFLEIINDKDSNSIYNLMTIPSFDQYNKIGLGFQLYSFEGNKAIGHYGGDKGFRSFLIMFPAKNMGLVLLANCDYHEDFRQEILMPIAKMMLTYSN